jgi:hypothetical protein
MRLPAKEGIRRGYYFDEFEDPAYNGFCARMCAAYMFLLVDEHTRLFARDLAVEPRYVKYSPARGDSHYFLEGRDGWMDLNYAPNEIPDPESCDYAAGRLPTRTDSFRPLKDDPRFPRNRDSCKIMRAVWARLEAEQSSRPEDLGRNVRWRSLEIRNRC